MDVCPYVKALGSYISDTLCSSQQLFYNLYDWCTSCIKLTLVWLYANTKLFIAPLPLYFLPPILSLSIFLPLMYLHFCYANKSLVSSASVVQALLVPFLSQASIYLNISLLHSLAQHDSPLSPPSHWSFPPLSHLHPLPPPFTLSLSLPVCVFLCSIVLL